ncbi:MAG: flagellar protein FlaG [Bacillota bacterium]|uniref:flagellar protein FlaG n=1 Tax=Desulforudis sp. DRI-14 TaxID=3459793 RepID=UPI00347F3027
MNVTKMGNPPIVVRTATAQRPGTEVRNQPLEAGVAKPESGPVKLELPASGGTFLQFSVHEQTKDVIVRVLDSATGDVIREFPPEAILDMVANLLDLAGLLVDEKR